MKKRAVKKRRQLLVHHRHTGKRLPVKHTSYPVMVFLLALVGVFMVGFSLKAQAVDVIVNGRVPGDPPTGPAVITTPLEGDRFNSIPITVSGTCATDSGNLVKLYRNNFFSGAVMCDVGGTFEIQTDLFAGANLLETRIFNLGDTEGPTSTGITVYYDVPPEPAQPSGSGSGSSGGSGTANTGQFTIKTDNLYKGYYTGDQVEWDIEALGGSAPYAFTVEWGDGTSSTYSRKEEGSFKIKHIYEKPGGYRGSYPIKITGSDNSGASAFIQLSIIINDKDDPMSVVPASTSTSGPMTLLNYAWPVYGVSILMVGSFWLGERFQIGKFGSRTKVNRA